MNLGFPFTQLNFQKCMSYMLYSTNFLNCVLFYISYVCINVFNEGICVSEVLENRKTEINFHKML